MSRTPTAVVVLALLGGLVACGGDDPGSPDGSGGPVGPDAAAFTSGSASQIAAAARAAMAGLDTVHFAGTVSSDGVQVALDVTVSRGGDCAGSFDMGAKGSGDILSVGGTTWLRPDEAFWLANAGDRAEQTIALVGDDWVLLPADSTSFDEICDIDAIVDSDSDSASPTYDKVGSGEVDGQPVVRIRRTDGRHPGGEAAVLTGDQHWIVELRNESPERKGSVRLDRFDRDFAPQPPAADQVVDLSDLGG